MSSNSPSKPAPHCCSDHTADKHADIAVKPVSTTNMDQLQFHIQGMDCPACVAKISKAVEKLPGTGNIEISLMKETMQLTLDQRLTSVDKLEKIIESLGYKSKKLASTGPTHHDEKPKWWQSRKGKLTLLSAGGLIAAFILSAFMPPFSFWFYSLAALIAIIPIAQRAFASLWYGVPFTIEMLMTIAAIGAIFIHAAQEAAIVVLLFSIGELLEDVATNQARTGIKALASLTPKTALLVKDNLYQEIAAADLQINDIIAIRAGDRIAADGIIIEGSSTIDESPVTGESIGVERSIGDKIYAGSINGSGSLRARVTTSAQDNTIARIIALVEQAQEAKAPTQRFIDQFSSYYMPIIVGIAILTAIVPPLFFDQLWSVWIYRALTLLLIGCPCALVISVPAAIASALSAGTRQGLLIKGGHIVETLAKVKTITFDKTGTLTQGHPVVSDIISYDLESQELIAIVAGIEQESSHPLANAIKDYASTHNITIQTAQNIETLPGKGIRGDNHYGKIVICAPRFLSGAIENHAEILLKSQHLEDQGKTVIAISINDKIAGLISLRDEARPDAKQALAELKTQGIESVILTGDNQRTANVIAAELGIKAQAQLLPEDKVRAIQTLQQTGIVAMVGDGINDAPALATADVGIAMGAGTDVALETADAAILRNRVSDIGILISLSRTTMTIIRQNITIALGLKLLFLITTLIGLTGLWIAILADTGATVLVTINALRLLAFKPNKTK